MVVPVFDPGIALNEGLKSENDTSGEDFGTETQSDGVWPELRRDVIQATPHLTASLCQNLPQKYHSLT